MSDLASPDFKKAIVAKLIKKLEEEMGVMLNAALEAHEAATHEQSKADNKYDTRGLEASYLAEGQARRASELERLIHGLQELAIVEYKEQAPIGLTSLVELQSNDKKSLVFLVPKGGGTTLEVEGKKIQIVTPESRLGGELIGRRKGDDFEMQIADKPTDFEILNIY